ncbi:LLM class F420-dependent oxidoreductase [Amycolatopsis roodepoortensis]|nr:LLM class F420-dependent oxidoreductase [Amycolatopsis roodepoortensis]
MRRYGLTLPIETVPLSAYRELVTELPDLGFTDVWSGEAGHADGFTPLALATAFAPSLRIGTAIVPVQTRGPALLAMTAATMANAAPAGFVLGVGSSGPMFVERINGIPFEQPFDRVRDMVRFLRRALDGQVVAGDFGTFSIERFQVSLPPRQVPVMVAALRPRMLRLAVREADGAIINFLSPADVKQVVATIGADGDGKELVARLFVCPTTDADYARELGRRIMTGVITSPNYAAFHEWLGRGELLAPAQAAMAAGDHRGALSAVPDQVIDDLLIHGSPGQCQDQVRAYVEAGVTTPVLSVQPAPEYGTGLHGMRQAVRALAPEPTRTRGS